VGLLQISRQSQILHYRPPAERIDFYLVIRMDMGFLSDDSQIHVLNGDKVVCKQEC